jgi:hypothetical protein
MAAGWDYFNVPEGRRRIVIPMAKGARWLAPLLALACLTCASPPGDGRVALTLELVEDPGGRPVPGLIRVRDARGRALPLPPLLPRGLGLAAGHPSLEWYVLPGRSTIRLPRERLTIEAFRGLETELTRVTIGAEAWEREEIRLPLRVFLNAAGRGWRGANTHLHLKEISRAEADRYLTQVPPADGLDVLFVSYLERAEADRTYVSNRYTEEELRALGRESGVLFGNGEEHRHNFGGFEEGYGHVMFLELRKLIRPVSIGRGIMKEGVDAPPLRDGIDEARRQGATVVWCHNTFGLEDLPSWIAGRPHAQNIFDGDPEAHGSYGDTFYRYLNAGLRVPFSTGTDWFIYDFSRAYAAVPALASPRDWLRALEAGRTFITNGPFLDFEVEGKPVGETVALAGPGQVRVTGGAVGRVDFRRLELVRNGEVVGTAASRRREGHFAASIETVVKVDGPCWLALRLPPPPLKEAAATADVPRTELGGPLFAHTSPVYVEVAGRGVFREEVAKGLLEEMAQAKEKILRNGVFADDHQRDHVLSVYALAISALEKRLAK